MQTLIDFITFKYPNIAYVLIGTILLSVSSAIVGTFSFLRKKSLVGDVIAHAVLPGICLAFILSGTKNPLWLITGAFITGWLSVILLDYITRHSKIKEDTATGLILSVFFGIGILMLTYIQHSGNAGQSGLDNFLFGKAASLVGQDLSVFALIAVIILGSVWFMYKELKLIAFDSAFAQAIGLPVRRFEIALTSLTVLAVLTGIQAVGVVLMSAMLITPAAAARFWTNRLGIMLLLAASFGIVSGFTGAYISFVAPGMPTGPWMVLILSVFAIVSFLFAPRKGIFYKNWHQFQLKRKYLDENILKGFYQLGETNETFFEPQSTSSLLSKLRIEQAVLLNGLKRLKRQGFLIKDGNYWRLTPEGFNRGKRIVRIHRLWELYLTEYLKFSSDHVHEDAESVEHIITPELESKLEKLLAYPTTDPHQSIIPPKM